VSHTQQVPRTADARIGDWTDVWPSAAPAAAFSADLVVVALDGGHRWPMVSAFVVLAAVTAVCSVGVRPWTVALVALLGWMFATGFLSHAYGDLTPLGGADLARLGVLLLVGFAAAVAAPGHRPRR
jgi:hypothetical protein